MQGTSPVVESVVVSLVSLVSLELESLLVESVVESVALLDALSDPPLVSLVPTSSAVPPLEKVVSLTPVSLEGQADKPKSEIANNPSLRRCMNSA